MKNNKLTWCASHAPIGKIFNRGSHLKYAKLLFFLVFVLLKVNFEKVQLYFARKWHFERSIFNFSQFLAHFHQVSVIFRTFKNLFSNMFVFHVVYSLNAKLSAKDLFAPDKAHLLSHPKNVILTFSPASFFVPAHWK